MKGELITPINTKPGTKSILLTEGIVSRKLGTFAWFNRCVTLEAFRINTIGTGLPQISTMTDIECSLLFVSIGGADQRALGIVRVLGDNIDHPIDSISSPQRTTGTTNDFNTVNIF